MSMQLRLEDGVPEGAPELTALGKRIELLRIERGLSKQVLARRAGTSRQQLWRVMTGKSELTGTLCLRLAEALGVDGAALRVGDCAGPAATDRRESPASLAQFLSTPLHIERILASLPRDDAGDRIAAALLRAVSHAASGSGEEIPAWLMGVLGDRPGLAVS